jgi:hypothetical protein
MFRIGAVTAMSIIVHVWESVPLGELLGIEVRESLRRDTGTLHDMMVSITTSLAC